MTFTPSKHWGARTLHDQHRGYGGFVLEHQGRKIYHAGDSAYFDGFKEIGRKLAPEIALLPIGAYHPGNFPARPHGAGRGDARRSRIWARNVLCRCTTARSSCRSRIWTNRRAGCWKSPRQENLTRANKNPRRRRAGGVLNQPRVHSLSHCRASAKSFSVNPPASCVVSASVTLFQRMSMSG